MPLPQTSDDFVDLVRKSGIVEPADLDTYLQKLQGATPPPADARAAAQAMLRDGVITGLQAGCLLKGKWRKFIINGKYKLLEHLGSGGMGHIYLCEHTALRRLVALKVLPADKSSLPGVLDRFRREARAVAALNHPNIVRAHDIDGDGKLHFLVMEYVDGVNLQHLVSKHGPLAVDRAVDYVRQAAGGLQHAHEAGLVHRDIKPGNLLLERTGVVKILDMGLARFFHDQRDNLTREYESDVILGTADYLAPEQALDSSTADIRADIYALGATLFFLLTGRGPFDHGTAAQKLLWHQTARPKPVREFRPEAPEGLAAVIARMLEKDPARRPQTPAEVAGALAPWQPEVLSPPPEQEMPRRSQAVKAVLGARSDRYPLPSTPRAGVKPASQARRPSRPLLLVRGNTRWLVAGVVGGVAVLAAGASLVAMMTSAPSVTAARTEGPPAAPPARPAPRAEAPAAGPTTAAAPAQAPAAAGGSAWWEVNRFTGHQGMVERVALSRDGKRALSAGFDKVARLWDVESGQELAALEGHPDTVHGVAIAPDGRRAATGCNDATARVWDLALRRELLCLRGHINRVWSLAFSPDGKYLLTGSADKTARLWNAETGEAVRTFAGHEKEVNCVAYAPNGRHVATASWDGTARLWDAQTGAEVRRFEGHASGVTALTFSSDGRRLLTGSYDTSVRLWDVENGQQLKELRGHADQVWMVALTPEGRRAASCGADRTVRVWDLETGEMLATLRGHEAGVTGVVFLPDGRRILSSSQDNTLRLWRGP
jgi:serine/threonine protein kinase